MQTVLITGSNRGIGYHLLQSYLDRGDRVIAAVRDPSAFPLDTGNDNLRVIKVRSDSEDDAREAVEVLRKEGVEKLDIVIANAAVDPTMASLLETKIEDIESAWRVNVRGPLILFQAVYPLLKEGSKFVVISSGAGVLGQEFMPVGQGAYGHSKTAVNYIVRKLHFEHPTIPTLALDPGWVPTDMGMNAAIGFGKSGTPDKLEDTIPGMVKVIDELTKERYSGLPIRWNGAQLPW